MAVIQTTCCTLLQNRKTLCRLWGHSHQVNANVAKLIRRLYFPMSYQSFYGNWNNITQFRMIIKSESVSVDASDTKLINSRWRFSLDIVYLSLHFVSFARLFARMGAKKYLLKNEIGLGRSRRAREIETEAQRQSCCGYQCTEKVEVSSD